MTATTFLVSNLMIAAKIEGGYLILFSECESYEWAQFVSDLDFKFDDSDKIFEANIEWSGEEKNPFIQREIVEEIAQEAEARPHVCKDTRRAFKTGIEFQEYARTLPQFKIAKEVMQGADETRDAYAERIGTEYKRLVGYNPIEEGETVDDTANLLCEYKCEMLGGFVD